MVIVAGHITVEPQQRESYLAGCVGVVEQARGAVGCLDFAITADLIDPGRINVFERWESHAAVETFRGNGPSDEQGADMLSASVADRVRRRRHADPVRGRHSVNARYGTGPDGRKWNDGRGSERDRSEHAGTS